MSEIPTDPASGPPPGPDPDPERPADQRGGRHALRGGASGAGEGVRAVGGLDGPEVAAARVEPLHLPPLLPRRQSPWLLVEVDGSPAAYGALVWALREAARREATVVALAVLDAPEGNPFGSASRVVARAHSAAHDRVQAQLLRAIAETGVHGRSRSAVLDRPVLDALAAASRGGDLVVVGAHGKTLLRQAVPRPPARRLARGA